MEKRVFGVVLTLLGIGGLVYAAIATTQGGSFENILIFGILGAIFFFSGIGLIKNTRDVKKRSEEIS